MQKILIIRFSSIGDIVLTTPVIRCVKKQLNAEVHFLTKKQYQPLLEANPFLSKIFTIEKKVAEVTTALKEEDYGLIVDLHKNLRSWQVRLSLGKRTYSFDKLNLKKWLFVNFRIDWLPDLHIVDRYLASVERLGVKNDGEGLDYFFPDDRPPPIPEASLGQAVHHLPYIAFAIGAAHKTKRLPVEKIIDICEKIDQPVLLLGGESERNEGEKIVSSTNGNVINLCGKLSLHESAAVILRAEKTITHDTGMMHIAAAFQKEIIVVWGNTVPAFGMSPYFGDKSKGSQMSFEVKNLKCRPCSKIGFSQCPKKHFKCMNGHDTIAIAAAAKKQDSETKNK